MGVVGLGLDESWTETMFGCSYQLLRLLLFGFGAHDNFLCSSLGFASVVIATAANNNVLNCSDWCSPLYCCIVSRVSSPSPIILLWLATDSLSQSSFGGALIDD